MGKPVLIGEHTFNFNDATQQAIAAGAAIRITPSKLTEQLNVIMNDETKRQEMSKAALAFSTSARGATERLMKLIGKYLAN